MAESTPRQLKTELVRVIGETVSTSTEVEMASLVFAEVHRTERDGPERDLPAATVFLGFVDEEDYATGGITQNRWRFIVRLYFDLSLGDKAQEQYEELLPALLTSLRRDRSLGGLADYMRVQDGGDPIFSSRTNLLIKTIYVIPETEED